MTDFDSSQHPRSSAGTFSEKGHSPAEVDLSVTPEQGYTCAECGEAMTYDRNGVSNHLTSDSQIDYDADGDHVVFDDRACTDCGAHLEDGDVSFELCRDCRVAVDEHIAAVA